MAILPNARRLMRVCCSVAVHQQNNKSERSSLRQPIAVGNFVYSLRSWVENSNRWI